MEIQRNHKGIREFVIPALVAAVLGGCATSREQPPAAANADVALSREAAQPILQQTKARAPVTRARPMLELSTEKNTPAILAQIHQANLKEIEIGKIAQLKASTSEVRAYADQLLQDHANADQTVVAMAQKMGAHLRDVAAGPRDARHDSARGKVAEQKLNSLMGADFDRLFLQQASLDHERLIRTLQQEREDASDDSIEALIDKMIPILEQDRELAQILLQKEEA